MSKVGTSFFTTRESGTGLGLVLARNVIEQHGGSLEISSEQGRGTTVSIKLPAASPSDKGGGR
jgi:signal transduction histidine kinase